MAIEKQSTTDKNAALATKIAAMSDTEKEARVQEIYATPTDKRTEDDISEFFAIMFGGVSTLQ